MEWLLICLYLFEASVHGAYLLLGELGGAHEVAQLDGLLVPLGQPLGDGLLEVEPQLDGVEVGHAAAARAGAGGTQAWSLSSFK